LLDANIDWGQDVLRLKQWIDDHPDANPLHTAITTFVPLDSVGIESEPIPRANESGNGQFVPLKPDWYAISVNQLIGYKLYGSDRPECMQFQQMEPVDRIGYSIYIYHVEGELAE